MALRRPSGCACSPSEATERVEEQIYAETKGPAENNEEQSVSKQLHEQSETETKIEEEIIHLTGDLTITVFPPEFPPPYAPKTTAIPRRFRVSSQVLAKSSKYFAAMLTGRWSEGRKFHANGTVDLEILVTDPDTFSTLRRILPSLRTARSMIKTLDQLTMLAVQADYFQCEEVLRDPSLPKLRLRFEKQFDRSLLSLDARWVFLAWMYGDADRFQRAISTIRGIIIGCFAGSQNEERCCYICNSFKLGPLIRELKAMGIDTENLSSHYLCADDSFDDLRHKLRIVEDHTCISCDIKGRLFNQPATCDASCARQVKVHFAMCDSIPEGLRLQYFTRP